MDPVELFIQSQQSFSLELLVNAHSRLCVVQLQKGSVTQEDALYCCKAQVKAQLYSELVIKAHVSLILESAISASMAANGQLKLSVTKDVIGNDSNFVSSVLAVLSRKCTGINYKGLDGFKKDALAYLHRLQELSAPDRPPAVNSSVESVVIGVAAEVMDKPISKPSNSRSVILAHAPFKEPSAPGNNPSAREGAGAGSGSAVGGDKFDFERNESMARFLAQARRTGMDVLFPQIAHDKVTDNCYIYDAGISLTVVVVVDAFIAGTGDYFCGREVLRNIGAPRADRNGDRCAGCRPGHGHGACVQDQIEKRFVPVEGCKCAAFAHR